MSQSSLFVALSTGQNIANLLPILELVEPGDTVLWVESATAQKLKWGEGALEVLRAQGVNRIETGILDDDEPASVHRFLSKSAEVGKASCVRLVGNGGTKLQMLAAVQALGSRLDELVYNHDQRCLLERFGKGPAERPLRQPYRRHRIDLPDILRCRNMEMAPQRGVRIWPGRPQELPRFGCDIAYTAKRHEEHWQWGRLAPEEEGCRTIPYNDVRSLLPALEERFRANLPGGAGPRLTGSIGVNAAASIYHAARNLEARAREAVLRSGISKPPEIGPELESAVAARLLHWLDGVSELAKIVQSIWRNVEVRECGKTEKRAELDVALVLKNGLLLSLECKAFDASLKDLDARLGVLQRSSSALAKMAVCMPSYPSFAASPWCQELIRKEKKIAGWGQFRLIPFTFLASGMEATDYGGEQPCFEDSLSAWLRLFVGTED